MSKKTLNNWLALALIVALSVFFRYYSLGDTPHWDWDEGVNMNIAEYLADGKIQVFALKYAFFPHPPLFFLLESKVLQFFGDNIVSARAFTAAYGVLITFLLYFVGKELFDAKTGLLASLLYAVFPAAVYWGRLVFANNQLIFFSTLALYAIVKYTSKNNKFWLYVCCISAGLGFLTQETGFATILAVSALLLEHDRNIIPHAAAIMLAPFAFFVAFMLAYTPEYFMFDVFYQLGRFNMNVYFGLAAVLLVLLLYRKRHVLGDFYKPIAGTLNEIQPLMYVLMSLGSLLVEQSDKTFGKSISYFMPLCLSGLFFSPFFLIDNGKSRRILQAFFLPYFAILLILNRGDHMTMLVYPYLMLLMAAFAIKAYDRTVSWLNRFQQKITATTIALALIFHPIGVAAYIDFRMVVPKEVVGSQYIAYENELADYVNNNTSPDDVVIGYSYLSPLLKAKLCILTQSVAYEGRDVAYYSGSYSKERFAFNCSYKNAKYVIASNGTINVLSNDTAFDNLLAGIEKWPAEDIGYYRLYKNPFK